MPPVAPGAKAPPALPAFPKLSRGYRMQYEQVQSAWVLLYPEGMVKLNDSSAEILRRCNGERSIDAMVADLEILFNAKGIAPQVRELLHEGMRRGWIV
ncbi:MAG: pyrroloquinoline quinone biosynthesis peptide chaperone PqqD [Polaromonas sp.]|nr:pyrroloquinoline quinone biosynthesis peptide chaperone PqqD [Polaromonas sp.]